MTVFKQVLCENKGVCLKNIEDATKRIFYYWEQDIFIIINHALKMSTRNNMHLRYKYCQRY